MQGFMLCSAFKNYYTQQWVMDVKDCIVDHDNSNLYTVKRMFDHMMDHIQEHGGKHWRARFNPSLSGLRALCRIPETVL